MTKQINAITVTLDKAITTTEAEKISEAVKLISGVVGVNLNVANAMSHIAYETARQDILSKIKTIFNKNED